MKELQILIRIIFLEKKAMYVSVICGFIAGLTAVALFASSGYLLSQSAFAPPIYTLIILVASIKLLGITSALSRYGERYYSHQGTFSMLSHLRVLFYEKLTDQSAHIFQKHRSGDLLAKIIGDVETLQNFFLRVFYPPIVIALIFSFTIYFTSFFSLGAAVLLFLGFILTTILIPAIFALRQRKVKRPVRQYRANLSTNVTEFLYGFRDLKTYQKQEKKKDQLFQVADAYVKEQEAETTEQLFSESLNGFLASIMTLLVLGYGAYLVANGQLNGVYLALLVMISLTVFENVTSMAVFPSHFEDNRQAASRLNEIVKSNDKQDQASKKKEELILSDAPSIKIEHASFTFPDQSMKAIDDVTFKLPAGSKTAIVGPSGSGKSTLLNLLLSFYSLDQGDIRLNNKSYQQIEPDSIWKNTNVILQHHHFFYGTVEDNLLLANKAATMEELQHVLAAVQLENLDLQDQILEKAENLSGGEKQRLAIARILLKRSPLWLLDEPTSSLDPVTESAIYNHLMEVAKQDTLVLITHRLTGLDKMDQIIVMDHGKIVEIGTYKTLMEKQGYFYRMNQIEKNVISF
ncbi:thiol reductant ABC exporter subunit CydC [Oceanobacillus halophilus]|uniref:Thiol reductant ABC exporter subunit CydC n=1 Tax=Oceanobacillus halophilus TaxID=930130 RepID=A0A494ZVL5_9BACI|nr:thiol reductant ABC exporter subunit CydC [Oceanobacillus halophilus]RKQ30392.1 thiol reductant ABC exporter subunit CydC [Oceanobacillus halophilus]